MSDSMDMPGEGPDAALVSVVIPAHNEADGIGIALSTIGEILQGCDVRYELIVVDDGSKDDTYARVSELNNQDKRIKGIRFSRNFGKESAILAGLKQARGDAVITIDADLQHPPQVIPQMIEDWRKGARVVHAVKEDRSEDSLVARGRAVIFNGILTKLGGIDIHNASDFKLLDRVAVDILVRQLPEHERFYRGLADWVGFSQTNVYFTVASRQVGESKWSLGALIELATTAIVSFTSTPLRIITILGFITLVFGFFVGIETLWSWFSGKAVSGFATIIITVLLLGSFIMISLGVIGEYIAKIYEEIKARPVFIVEELAGFDDDGEIDRKNDEQCEPSVRTRL